MYVCVKMAQAFWFAVAAVSIALLLYLKIPAAVYTYYRRLKASRQLPGWPTHWLWGNVHQISPSFHNHYVELRKLVQNGRYKVTRRWIGPFSMEIEIFHPEMLKKILKEPKDESIYRLLRPWLGDGLLVSRGEKWARNRRLLTPAFHYEILKSYVQVYCTCTDVLCNKWKVFAGKKEQVKLFDTVSMLSLDIVLQCACSYKSNCQELTTSHPYIKGVLDVLELVVGRYLNPLYQIDWIYWLTPAGRRLTKACKLVHDQSERVIRERKSALGLDGQSIGRGAALDNAKKQHKYLDFLDILLTAEDEDGKGLTDLEIRDEVDTFMFEGHDTTTSGMCWTLYCLAKHPEHQDKVREEVRNVLMGRDWLEYDDLKELKYTQWCIKEAMRLYPPVTDVMRVLSQDTEFEGVLVPKGTKAYLKTSAYHRHPDVWENPNVYDPLRFSPSNSEGRDPFAYIPFSAGNRNCIGQNFALNEEKIVVAMIVSNFKLIDVPEQEIEYNPIGILKVKGDILVNLELLDK